MAVCSTENPPEVARPGAGLARPPMVFGAATLGLGPVRRVARLGAGVVRSTIDRTWAAGIGAILALASMLAPPEASARAGFGRATFNQGAVNGIGGHPLVWPKPAGVTGSIPVAELHGARFEPHHRRFFGLGLPLAGIGVAYGPFDAPIADVGTIARPPEASQAAVVGSVCRSENWMAASEAGGERPITITWCRKG